MKSSAQKPSSVLTGFQFWTRNLRKPFAALFLTLAIVGGGAATWATAASQTVAVYLSAAAASLGLVGALPRQIRETRTAADGTTFRDFNNGMTLISHPNGSSSYVESRPPAVT
jgi:hypothetical protein